MHRLPRPGSKGAKTREAILRAAERLFAERGFAACRLEDIGASVGIRRASIVYHFRDKPTLYDGVLDSVFGNLLDRYRIVFSQPEPVADRMLGMINAWVTYAGERPSLVRLFLRALTEPKVHPAVSRHVLPIMDELVGFLRQGQERGVFAPVDPVHFFNAIGGMTLLLLTAGPISWPGWVDGTNDPDILEKHRKELLGITRRLLGLPMGAEASAPEEPRQTARVGGSA